MKHAKLIIKTQWFNNIIRIGDKDFRYVNFANYSNGDMIVETTSCQGNSKRMFYGMQSNGRPFYKYLEKEEYTYHFSIEVKKEQTGNKDKYRYEAKIFIATINNRSQNGNEYLISISKDT